MNSKFKSTSGRKKDCLIPDPNIFPPLPGLAEALYIHDRDFKPYGQADIILPPSFPTSPQDREILRRLMHVAKKRAIQRVEELEQLCPKGLALGDDLKQFLANYLGNSQQEQEEINQALWLADYVAPPPTMAEFLADPRYLGNSLGGVGPGSGLWPAWRTLLLNQFDLDSFVHNLVLTGGIGIGKTLVMVLLVLYRICIVAHLRDPRRFFGHSPDGSISFVIMSVTKDTVRATAWQQALRWMEGSAFFCDDAGLDLNRTYSDLRVELRSLASNGQHTQLILSGGSQSQHLLGRDTLVIAMDEGNFRLEADPQSAAYQLFTDMRARMASRFQLRSGFMPGISIIASSAEDESAFTERLTQEITKGVDPVAEAVIRCAIYRVKPGMTLKPWWFRVAYGLPNTEPRILGGAFSGNGLSIDPPVDCPFVGDNHAEAVPDGMLVEFIPGDYYKEFTQSPRRSLQQLSGISVGGTHRLFATLADIDKCVELSKSEGLENPLKGSRISVSNEDISQIWDALLQKAFVMHVGAGYGPKRATASPRFAHMDLAITGKAGLAICHLRTAAHPAGSGGDLGVRLVVEFDLILTLVPGRERPIAFEKIKNFIIWLRQCCGYSFAKITADSFQSEYLLQSLASNGFKTDKLSVDRSPDAYHALRAGFEAGAVRLYPQEEFLAEAGQLLEIGGKIDHPSGSSKDTADAVAGAYFNAITSEEAKKLTLGNNQTPTILGGQSQSGITLPEDSFGLYQKIQPRPTRVFHV